MVIARRAADPDESGKGPIDAVVLDPVSIPSHHGPDVNTVLPGFPVISMAMKIPTTHMHLHSLIVSVKGDSLSTDKVIDKLSETPRLMFVDSKRDGIKSTGNVMESCEGDGQASKRHLRGRRLERFDQSNRERDLPLHGGSPGGDRHSREYRRS